MKRGQLKLSFGMIFSIILIIIFLVFGFYVIKNFILLQDSVKTERFLNDFQADIDRIWKSTESSQQKEYIIPSGVGFACFVDYGVSKKGTESYLYTQLRIFYSGSENLIFYPLGSSGVESKKINNIDLEKITQEENPFCIENNNGEIQLTLMKDFDEALVTITR